jgi:hypothetical protein
VIKLKNILEELEVGKVLFGDPNKVIKLDRWQKLNIEQEPNTEDEDRIIRLLQRWITQPHLGKNDMELGEKLKQLLPLKNKFSRVLDPTSGRDLYEGTSLYRGTVIPLKDLMNMTGTWSMNNSVGFVGGALTNSAPYMWSAIGSGYKGFTSFTPDDSIAETFAQSYSFENDTMRTKRDYDRFVEKMVDGEYMGMIPVVLQIPDTYPTALINPYLSIALTDLFTEYEVFVLGDSIKVPKVNLINWADYARAFDRAGVDPAQYFKGL